MPRKKSQFQSLGSGTYRVMGARVSPTTGRYVTVARESEGNVSQVITTEQGSGSGDNTADSRSELRSTRSS